MSIFHLLLTLQFILGSYGAAVLNFDNTERDAHLQSSDSYDTDTHHVVQERIAYLKAQILSILNLEHPPSAPSLEYTPSKRMIELLEKREEERRRALLPLSEEDPKLFSYPINRNYTCQDHDGIDCTKLQFELPLEADALPLDLWVYVTERIPPAMASINIFSSNSSENTEPVHQHTEVIEQNTEVEWVKLELPPIPAAYSTSGTFFYTVEINGLIMEVDNEYKPFLEITNTSTEMKRSRRDDGADSCNSTCCLKHLTISTSDTGFETWIYSPSTIEVNYCVTKEKCSADRSKFRTSYERFLAEFIERNSTAAQRLNPNCWQPTCKPHTYEDVRILYVSANQLHSEYIPNVKVTSCVCGSFL